MFQTLVERREVSGRLFVIEADFKARSFEEMFGEGVTSDDIDTSSVLECVEVRCQVDAQEVPRGAYTEAMRDALKFSALMDETAPPTDAYWLYPNGDTERVTLHRAKRRRKE